MLSTLNVRSHTHNSCEDTIFTYQKDGILSGGVFDGCSSGKNSHWASQTIAYLFENQLKKYPYMGKVLEDSTVKEVLKSLHDILGTLGIGFMHALSTCILFSYNESTKMLQVRIFGDGFFYVNDVEYSQDQKNEPDYLAYHNSSDINLFLENYPIQTFFNVDSFKICSDGIESIQLDQFHESTLDPMRLLFLPPSSNNYLARMWNRISKEKFKNYDDLSIISYVKD